GPGSGGSLAFAVRRARAGAAAGAAPAAGGRGAGAADSSAALPPDGRAARGLRRSCDGARRDRRALREGAMSEPREAMLEAARRALVNAHAPYSRFRAGACGRAARGGLYAGGDVENAADGLTHSAEGPAVGRLGPAAGGA